jgi:hypothetical protein
MGLTFAVIAAFALVLLGIGLLMTRNVRWGSVPIAETRVVPAKFGGAEVFIALAVIAIAASVIALVWLWGLVALPH